jgi:hypothetical protein
MDAIQNDGAAGRVPHGLVAVHVLQSEGGRKVG